MAKKRKVDPEAAPVSQVVVLRDLVAYQSGSIVSRTLVDRKTGTVTLFAFDKGQGLSEHSAAYDAMVCVLDGRATITIAGKAHEVRKGQMILMPANVPHALRAAGRFKLLLTMLKPPEGR